MDYTTEEIIRLSQDYVLPTYTRSDIVFVRGEGSYLWDVEGNKYLDFFPGWGVSNLGHCHPAVIDAVKKQVEQLIHIPNNFYNQLQPVLAERIIQQSFPGKVFFCNSGTEAVESAIKLAKAYGEGKRFEIITMKGSFHGRTLGSLSATGQEKYQKDFYPLVEGFKHIDFNNIDALKEAINAKTIAVILEPVQGEGGIYPAEVEYLKEVRKICSQKDILLIFDEVQTGMGRCGDFFAFKSLGVQPDAFTLAKALGGGLPIGALIVSEKYDSVLSAGQHASTFGGSPIVCAAALAVFDVLGQEGFLKRVREKGLYLEKKLLSIKGKFNFISELRALGLMQAIHLKIPGSVVVQKALKKLLLVNCTQEKVIRLMPALIVDNSEIDKAVDILEDVFGSIS